ncbi:hypothetical protein JOC77_000556 [Peribacillus deserti]|uniref:Uncharacterized protein n=1 Tax=Peribacillus deserti TaxID=673318 RepID=A0ABS2QFS2_9BACI|nr:hypothetical protein [Peribacillus deserti]MBM7691151.1 hypothetical protein [Peribacillus deserti]
MEQKPEHYDGSPLEFFMDDFSPAQQPFQITSEMRASISGNPYTFEINE